MIGTTANQSTRYTKTELDNNLALKQNVINNVPGTGERILEADAVKRIFAISPVQMNTSVNVKDPDDPEKAPRPR
jgi:hypothetical protein